MQLLPPQCSSSCASGKHQSALRLHCSRPSYQQPGRQLTVAVRAESPRSSARSCLPSQLLVDRQLGEGSFGQVFAGTWKHPTGDVKVVLKRVKKVEGAAAMAEMELMLNAYAAKVAKAHCAEFLGYSEVSPEEASSRLTAGLWLVWKYEGQRTLAYYLRRRDTLRALASDLEVQEEAVVATMMRQLLEGLSAFHAAGLVHRDIKPLNIIFAESIKRFKLIDLGACADLRSGTNYVPEESILDPNYCPPEQYVLPTDAPHLAKHMLKVAISPMLWAQYKPDRFDMWSAGICLLQIAIPAMRQDRGLRNFNTTYGSKYAYDLDAWRAGSFIAAREFEVLDAEGGAGWDLAKALLRPRSIKTTADGTVVFVNDKALQRISAGEALRHKFFRQAQEPGSIFQEGVASTSGSWGGSAGRRSAGSSNQRNNVLPSRLPGAFVTGSEPQRSGRTIGKQSHSLERQRGGGASNVSAAAASGQQRESFGAAVGLWRNLTSRLFDLEANILNTASATEKQSTVVKKLQQKVVKGQVSADALRKEELKLKTMESKLSSTMDDFNSTASAVGNVLGMLGFGPGKAKPTGSQGEDKGGLSSQGNARRPPVSPIKPSLNVRQPAPSSQSLSSLPPNAPSTTGSFWSQVQDRLSSLQGKLDNQVSATERQSLNVRRLKQGVDQGAVDVQTLQRAESLLSRMEARLDKLDKDVRNTRQEATGVLGMMGLGGGMWSGGSGQQSKEQPVPNAEIAAQQVAKALDVNPAQPSSGGTGFGGFFARMFGSSQGSKQSVGKTEAGNQSGMAKERGGGASQAQSGKKVVGESQADVPQRAGGGGTSSGKDITDGASALIANSLKFTGMAAKVALGMAATLKADAEKALKQMEAEQEGKKQRKLQEQAFMRMLRSKDPAMTANTTYAEVEQCYNKDARFLAVEEGQRPLLVAAYVDALLQADLRAQAANEAKLRDRFKQVLSASSSWDDILEQVAEESIFKAVRPDVARVIFEEVMVGVRDEEEGRALVARSEMAFRNMLLDLDAPPIDVHSTWPLVKPQVWKDARYMAVPESRRREIFSSVQVDLVQAAKAAAEAQQARAKAEAESMAAIISNAAERKGGQAAPDKALIEQLRAEQARLRAEYDKMESKLLDMEIQLQAKQASGTIVKRTTPMPTSRAPPTPPIFRPIASATQPQHSHPASAHGFSHSANPGNEEYSRDLSHTQLSPPRTPRLQRVSSPRPFRSPASSRKGGSGDGRKEGDLADSLMAAGVAVNRLPDGTMVFQFDRQGVLAANTEVPAATTDSRKKVSSRNP